MAWRRMVKIRKPKYRSPLFHPEPGVNIVEVVDEPDEPITTRYGQRLPLIIKPLGGGDMFTWLVPYRDEVGDNSLLGQLKKIADEHDGLKGLRLKVTVVGSKGSRRYRVEVAE